MVNRIQPQGSPDAYKTYQILMPPETHTRPATCEEVECQTQAEGWITIIDEATDLGQKQAHYIRRLSGRVFNEGPRDVRTLFTFPPGEECFESHTASLDRDASYIVRGGDFRGNPRQEVYVHDTADGWVNDFADHQDRLARSQ